MSQIRQLAAIMFTDIVGYTSLMGSDEKKAFELLNKNRQIHKPVIEEFGGSWIKELGDGIMASFPSVSSAVYAAIKIQELCHMENAYQLRIGIHQGEVIFESGDIFGDAVNIASRIQSLASPGSIFVSESVQKDLLNKVDIQTSFYKLESYKNVKEPIRVFQVLTGEKNSSVQSISPRQNQFHSIVPDLNVDIWISFRFNDNLYDGWVSEFKKNLEKELLATCKEKLSIFFDERPEDQKYPSELPRIKSLIFIPVISQTYCDQSASIWKDEFQGFLEDVGKDGVGISVPLPNGTAVSRVIPVKIHDIDPQDIKLLEQELSGRIRSLDFIFKDDGVNRPLMPADDEKTSNPYRPLYRNQINKVANAIKEMVMGIKAIQRRVDFDYSSPSLTSREIVSGSASASLSGSAKVHLNEKPKPNIFLAWTSGDLKETREEMAIVLKKAGFNVLPVIDCPSDDEDFKEMVAVDLEKCTCSLHILSGEFGRRFETNDDLSFPQFQFLEAKKRIDLLDSDFHSFVWIHPQTGDKIKPAQGEFIKYIRNNNTRNMMFSNSAGPMQLVDDIRVVMMKEVEEELDTKDTDIFFIFNQEDEHEAMIITDQLSNEYPVEILNIMPDGDDQYREISSQQIPKSKLAVIYFKYAADWAIPFIKQIWKQVGGASSPTTLFFIGEDEPKTNLVRNFKAPKVVSAIAPKEKIPAEVKKVYTTVVKLN